MHGDTGLCFTRTERIKRMTGDHPNHMATLHTRKRHGTEYAFQLRCSRSRRYFNATSDYYDDTMLSCCAGSSSLLVVVVCRILRAWWSLLWFDTFAGREDSGIDHAQRPTRGTICQNHMKTRSVLNFGGAT